MKGCRLPSQRRGALTHHRNQLFAPVDGVLHGVEATDDKGGCPGLMIGKQRLCHLLGCADQGGGVSGGPVVAAIGIQRRWSWRSPFAAKSSSRRESSDCRSAAKICPTGSIRRPYSSKSATDRRILSPRIPFALFQKRPGKENRDQCRVLFFHGTCHLVAGDCGEKNRSEQRRPRTRRSQQNGSDLARHL